MIKPEFKIKVPEEIEIPVAIPLSLPMSEAQLLFSYCKIYEKTPKEVIQEALEEFFIRKRQEAREIHGK